VKQLKLTVLFLIVNFSGLAIGSWLMNNGPLWSLIMICFSIYLGKLFNEENNSKNKLLFSIHFMLNVGWNFIFFNRHWVVFGLITIVLLTSLLFLYFFKFSNKTKHYKYLLLPYIFWLCIATSLNLYIIVHNYNENIYSS
jgi:benzodiazapine receptor